MHIRHLQRLQVSRHLSRNLESLLACHRLLRRQAFRPPSQYFLPRLALYHLPLRRQVNLYPRRLPPRSQNLRLPMAQLLEPGRSLQSLWALFFVLDWLQPLSSTVLENRNLLRQRSELHLSLPTLLQRKMAPPRDGISF